MEQIKELLEILKETPEMALWGMGLYFLFILLKAASWITALTIVAKLLIKRYFDWQDEKTRIEKTNNEQEILYAKANQLVQYFDKKKISDLSSVYLFELMDALRSPGSLYIHETDIQKAIKKITEK